MARQKLIHLHGTGALTASKAATVGMVAGEIAVKNGAGSSENVADEARLYVMNANNTDVVAFMPELAVKALTDALGSRIDDLQGDGQGSIVEQLDALKSELEGQIDAITGENLGDGEKGLIDTKVDAAKEAIQEQIGDGFSADKTVAQAISTVEKTHEDFVKEDFEPLAERVSDAEGEIDQLQLTLAGYSSGATVQAAISAINEKFGAEYSKDNTVAKAIELAAKEGTDAQEALDTFVEETYTPAMSGVTGDITAINNTIGTMPSGEGAYATLVEGIAEAKQAGDDAKSTFNTWKANDYKNHTDAFDAHVNETDGKNKLHITAAERTAWQAATDSINAFLTGENVDGAVNTLKEIQAWLDTDGEGAQALSTTLADHADRIGDNEEALKTLNGDDTTVGSVAKAVKDAKDGLEGQITEITKENGTIDTKVKKAADDINTKIGTMPSEGAEYYFANLVAGVQAAHKAGDDAQDALDTFVEETYTPAMSGVTGDITAINNTIGTMPSGEGAYTTLVEGIAAAKQAGDDAKSAFNTWVADDYKDHTDAFDALSGEFATLKGAAVTSVEVTKTGSQKFDVTINNNKMTFDVTEMVIDCGSYE